MNMKCPKCGKEHENAWLVCDECGYTENNKISTALKILGYSILCIGIIGGFILGMKYKVYSDIGYLSQETFNLNLFLLCSISSTISGMLFFGISEIITLNQKIFSLLRK